MISTRVFGAIPLSSELTVKSDDADHEQSPSAEQVAEPATDDEADRERQRVATDDPLQRRGARAEVGADGRRGDVDDRAVEQVHDLDDQNDRQDEPAARMAVVAERCGTGGLVDEDGGCGLGVAT